MSDWIEVAHNEEFPPGTWQVVEYEDMVIAVFNIDGEFYAIEDICTHDGETLTGGDLEGNEVICPRHGARFDVTSGEALTAPAYEDLTTFEVRVDDGMVMVNPESDD
ncbi:MAG: non-heme iron oxygenase ferredoxin subunit [Gammaproteobacteria bacterium]|nr:non-heme iron oxygenase ferredoxin subunit [Gammaproteobacteria bacterium]